MGSHKRKKDDTYKAHSRFEDKLTCKVYDNVHGFIYLTEKEKELLSTPYFQRLNHIKQLGLSYFIFPGAVHTRFSHSLGVLHITEKLIQRLKKINHNFFNDGKIHQIARLAALLHDIGHYPLSHTIESSYKECSSYLNIKEEENINKQNICLKKVIEAEEDKEKEHTTYKNIDTVMNFKDKLSNGSIKDFFCHDKNIKDIQDDRYHHEKMAYTVINSPKFKELLINKFDLDSIDISLICSIIDGTNKHEDFFIISRLIKSNFDADQMDYMIRDTQNTGINASIDLDFIIDNLFVLPRNNSKIYGNKKFICFHINALSAIEQFLLAKYYWYSNILYYDKAYIVNEIARGLYSYLLLNDKLDEFSNIKKIEESLEKPENFFFFNDNYFWNQIYKIVKNPSEYKPDLILKFANMLINRDFPQVLDEKKFNSKITNLKNISFNPITKEDSDEFQKEIDLFRNTHYPESGLLSVPIDKEIIKVATSSSGEAKNKKELSNEELYLKNEDINITNDSKTCKMITSLHEKQFLNSFYEKSKSKKLYIFRIYDFETCLNKYN